MLELPPSLAYFGSYQGAAKVLQHQMLPLFQADQLNDPFLPNQNSELQFDCQELFEKQSDDFKKDILDADSLIVTIEAGNVASWSKFLGSRGIALGINTFGESAPYKEIYDHFNLSTEKIVSTIQERLRKKI